MFPPSRIVLEIQILEGTSVDTDEVAHDEPPHLDLLFCKFKYIVFSFFSFLGAAGGPLSGLN